MKNKKIVLLLATALVLGACGNEAAKPADDAKKEETTVEEKVDETETKESKDGVKEVANDEKNDTDDEKGVTDVNREPLPEAEKTMEEAVKIFHDHFKDNSIKVTKVSLTFFNEALDYEIEGFKDGEEYELKIADSGEVLEEKTEKDDDDTKLALDFEKIITAKEAMEKALEGQKEGAWVVEYELEIDDGKAVYDIDVENGTDVKIDATTSEVIDKD